ncbi:MAG: hypothetical protein WCV91_03055 [Candidatus Margulisiibacteriota bacterium]
MEIILKRDKKLSALAYLLGIPSLYIILTDRRKKAFVGFHGEQAFKLWWAFILSFFALRALINLIWYFNYLPGMEYVEALLSVYFVLYAAYCAYRSYRGLTFSLPH